MPGDDMVNSGGEQVYQLDNCLRTKDRFISDSISVPVEDERLLIGMTWHELKRVAQFPKLYIKLRELEIYILEPSGMLIFSA